MTEQLLREYVQTGSESAFRELVDRYINLVYSTAYRRLGGDAHLAQDTVQTVFSDLARKASALPATVMLGGWLHTHTCFVTGAMLRTNRRREAREKEATEIFVSSAADDWKTIAPMRLHQAPGANASTVFPLETLEVAPGETKIIRLDGRDRTFALQLRWPEGLEPNPKWHVHVSLQRPLAESPQDPLQAARTRSYPLRPASDGSYEAKDVLPGEYRVHARILSQQVPGGSAALEALGDGSVTVPDGESGVINIVDLELERPAQAGN